MSDKSSVASSWSKSKSESKPQIDESIIIPNEDVFDLKDYINSENSEEPTLNTQDPTTIDEPLKNNLKTQDSQTLNPEHLRRQDEEKYFYQPGHKAKSKDSSNWFIVTFLMTVVILGSLYFFFALEDKNSQISGLERQLSNKADNRVKGALEIKTPTSQNENTVSKSEITQTLDGVSDKNFSILADLKSLDFKIEKTNVSIDYLNNQIGSKTSLVKSSKIDGKNTQDIIDIYAAEKQSVLDKNTVIANLVKSKPDYILDKDNILSKNDISFSSLKSKTSGSTNKMYVGLSQNFTYIIETSNPSNGVSSQSSINDFIANIISKISFN